jgi:hypothetical protein
MLYKLPVPPKSSPIVTGRSLANRKMTAVERAFLAADTLTGEVGFTPTLIQVARLFKVSVPYVQAAKSIAAYPAVRHEVLSGLRSLMSAANVTRHKKSKAMTPAKWARADNATREQHIANLGLASVWDVVERLTA